MVALCLVDPGEAGLHARFEDHEQGTWTEWHCQPKQRWILYTCDVEAWFALVKNQAGELCEQTN